MVMILNYMAGVCLVMAEQTSDLEIWWQDDELVLAVEFVKNCVFLHHDLYVKLTPDRVRKHTDILIAICEELKEYGYKRLYAYSQCQSEKWKKLCKLFKFTETKTQSGETMFVKEF